jgi:hypothetical protein
VPKALALSQALNISGAGTGASRRRSLRMGQSTHSLACFSSGILRFQMSLSSSHLLPTFW